MSISSKANKSEELLKNQMQTITKLDHFTCSLMEFYLHSKVLPLTLHSHSATRTLLRFLLLSISHIYITTSIQLFRVLSFTRRCLSLHLDSRFEIDFNVSAQSYLDVCQLGFVEPVTKVIGDDFHEC